MLKFKPLLFTAIAISIAFVSVNRCSLPYHNLMRQQFERGKSEGIYELCIIPIFMSEWKEGIGYQNDTMVCCCPIGLLYEEMNIHTIDIDKFIETAYNHVKSGIPIQVSPELYSLHRSHKVSVDKDLKNIYEQNGIDGIIDILATKPIRDWERFDNEKFKYIVSICWQNDLFFYSVTNDEVLEFQWRVSGDEALTDKYYSLSNKDVWYNPLAEETKSQ